VFAPTEIDLERLESDKLLLLLLPSYESETYVKEVTLLLRLDADGVMDFVVTLIELLEI